MQASTIQQIINHFMTAFQELELQKDLCKIEAWATTIHRSMKTSSRSYHTPEHILHLADCAAPLQSLAALFHDIVYYQVDQGFSPEVAELITMYVIEENGKVRVKDDVDDNPLFRMTLDIFGFSPGQELSPFCGQNEFLSALFMNQTLASYLPMKFLAQTSAYIEATIPFRSNCWAFELKKRLESLTKKYQLSFSPGDLDGIICSSVEFANHDVDGFSESNSGTFLSGTWDLLPENNSSLREERVYSIRDYRQALQNMEHFFKHLVPENIFHRYQNTPSFDDYQQLQNIARHNVNIARDYLDIKLLAIAIVESLAELTGGDAPLVLFMGDLKKDESLTPQRLEIFLPKPEKNSASQQNPLLSNLLEDGRSYESGFDIRNSPISFFLYTQLEPKRIHQCLTLAKDMFNGDISAEHFLEKIGQSVVSKIASACAEMVPTRREELLRYVETTTQTIAS